ncbi:MAG: TIGR03862 family flavoprotein [Pseudomonadota bacterium]
MIEREERSAVVIGAGPAGLAAAEVLAAAGLRPLILDAMPSPARKFLMAGKSGLNLAKDEPPEAVKAAIGCARLDPMLDAFGTEAVKIWAEGLGEPVFTGSSRRVFPKAMKASPLLRKWLARLDEAGAELRRRWRWTGWRGDDLVFQTPGGERTIQARTTILALGGASWPRLGSDAGWVGALEGAGAEVAPFRPANMGFDLDWSPYLRERFAGAPVKTAALTIGGRRAQGDFVISETGLEGSLIYALSAPIRDALAAGDADVRLDLAPGRREGDLAARLARPRGKASRANHLRKTIGLSGAKAALLRELAPDLADDAAATAQAIKSLPLPVQRPRPIAEAISSAGGVAWGCVDDDLMLTVRPGVFAAGEMLDWEAPTGGYLITACLATGRWAGAAARRLSAT